MKLITIIGTRLEAFWQHLNLDDDDVIPAFGGVGAILSFIMAWIFPLWGAPLIISAILWFMIGGVVIVFGLILGFFLFISFDAMWRILKSVKNGFRNSREDFEKLKKERNL